MAATREIPFKYEVGPRNERTLEVFVAGSGYKPIPNMETLLELLPATGFSRDTALTLLLLQLSFAVELGNTTPHKDPLNVTWIDEFVAHKTEKMRTVAPADPAFVEEVDTFHRKMQRHTRAKNVSVAMRSAMMRNVDQAAQDYVDSH